MTRTIRWTERQVRRDVGLLRTAGLGFAVLSVFCLAGCTGFQHTQCNPIPESDTIAPTVELAFEYYDEHQRAHYGEVTSDRTFHVPEERSFSLVYSGSDNVGVKYLWFHHSYLHWPVGLPVSPEPLIGPTDFGESACSPRLDARRYAWEGAPRVHTFKVVAEDYHGNMGSSPEIKVVHGTPPEPLVP